VLEKRGPGDEDLDKLANLAKEYLETGKKPVESSDAHAPSSSTPPGPDPGLTNVVPAPAPNPAPSTANPIPLMEWSTQWGSESSSPSTFSSDSEDYGWLFQLHDAMTGPHSPQPNPNKRPLTGQDLDIDREYWTNSVDPPPPLRAAKVPKLEESGQANKYQEEHVQQPNPNKGPSTGPDPDFDWEYWTNLVNPPPPLRAAKVPKLEESGQANKYQVEHVQQPNPNKRPSTGPDPDFDWEYWTNLVNPPTRRPAKVQKLEESGQANEYQEVHVQQPDRGLGPSTGSGFDGNYHSEAVPVEYLPSTSAGLPVFHAPPPSPESADPELPSDHQSLNTDSEPVDLPAAIYAAKGKAKVSRRISGTTGEVWNAA
jgi:hypothetical protein